jgi:hypothetical protein
MPGKLAETGLGRGEERQMVWACARLEISFRVDLWNNLYMYYKLVPYNRSHQFKLMYRID